MGFLKKIFKPVSKVLDKIVPNEVKPFLPYAAAFAPMFAPGIMGAFGNSMMSRGLISGGLNLGSQLAQEGSEGDVNMLSALMAGGIGALSAPQSKTRSFFENTVLPTAHWRYSSQVLRGYSGISVFSRDCDFNKLIEDIDQSGASGKIKSQAPSVIDFIN